MAESSNHKFDMDKSKGDIFPYQPVKDCVETLDEKDYIGKKKLTGLLNRVVPFKAYAMAGRILASAVVPDKDQMAKLTVYFNYSIKGAINVKPFSTDNMDWDRVEQRLEGTSQEKSKKNTDQRTFFRVDNNKFLVPAYFTFGQRTVPKGLVHLIETTSSPICVYKLSEQALLEKKVVVKESKFEADDQMWYDRYVLQPHTRYQFDAGTTYLFVTASKTLFSLHVLVKPDGAKYGEDPFLYKKLLHDPYKQVPPTPRPLTSPSMPDELTFLMPTLPLPTLTRPSLPDEVTFLMPTLPLPTLPLPTLTKRPREEDTVQDDGPRVVKFAKSSYDYPHPDTSTVWYRETGVIETRQNYHGPEQTEPVDLSTSICETGKETSALPAESDIVPERQMTWSTVPDPSQSDSEPEIITPNEQTTIDFEKDFSDSSQSDLEPDTVTQNEQKIKELEKYFWKILDESPVTETPVTE